MSAATADSAASFSRRRRSQKATGSERGVAWYRMTSAQAPLARRSRHAPAAPASGSCLESPNAMTASIAITSAPHPATRAGMARFGSRRSSHSTPRQISQAPVNRTPPPYAKTAGMVLSSRPPTLAVVAHAARTTATTVKLMTPRTTRASQSRGGTGSSTVYSTSRSSGMPLIVVVSQR